MSDARRVRRGAYITIGASGVRYQQRAGGVARAAPVLPRVWGETAYVESVEAGGLTDVTQAEFIQGVNEWIRHGHLQLLAGLVGGMLVVAAYKMGAGTKILGALVVVATVCWYAARVVERRRRRYVLVYELDPEADARFQALSRELADMAKSGSLASVTFAHAHGDWKRNAGSTHTIGSASATVREDMPAQFICNLSPVTVRSQKISLTFLPDRLLVEEKGVFAALPYDAIGATSENATLAWFSRPPSDAIVVSYRWRNIRRDGGPDRRFKENDQIPIIRVAYARLVSASGLQVILQTTRLASALRFATALTSYAQTRLVDVATQAPMRDSIGAALYTLGLRPDAVTTQAIEAARQALRAASNTIASASVDPGADLEALVEQRLAIVDEAARVLLAALAAGEELSRTPAIENNEARDGAPHGQGARAEPEYRPQRVSKVSAGSSLPANGRNRIAAALFMAMLGMEKSREGRRSLLDVALTDHVDSSIQASLMKQYCRFELGSTLAKVDALKQNAAKRRHLNAAIAALAVPELAGVSEGPLTTLRQRLGALATPPSGVPKVASTVESAAPAQLDDGGTGPGAAVAALLVLDIDEAPAAWLSQATQAVELLTMDEASLARAIGGLRLLLVGTTTPEPELNTQPGLREFMRAFAAQEPLLPLLLVREQLPLLAFSHADSDEGALRYLLDREAVIRTACVSRKLLGTDYAELYLRNLQESAEPALEPGLT